eukprot:2045402-Amphidinium_carterae.1
MTMRTPDRMPSRKLLRDSACGIHGCCFLVGEMHVSDATTNSTIVKGSAKGDLDRGLKVSQHIVRTAPLR